MGRRWSWLLVPFGVALVALGWGVASFEEAATPQASPTTTVIPVIVSSSCVPSSTWPAIDYTRPEKTLTFNTTMRDGRPLVGLCIVALLDNAPFEHLQYVGTCITGREGQCSIQVPPGLIRLQFGSTTIDGLPLAESINKITALVAPNPDAIVYFFNATDEFEISHLVAVPRPESHEVILKVARVTDDGLMILQPDVPQWSQASFELTPTPTLAIFG